MRLRPTLCLLVLLPLLAACGAGGTDASAANPAAGNAAPAGQAALPLLAIGEPQLFANSDWALYPLPLAKASRREENEYGSYERSEPNRYWQVLFYNARTGQVRQLAPGRKLLFHSISQPQDEHEQPLAFSYTPSPYTSQNLLLYSVAAIDFNRDGRLNEEDPAYLFVSTKSGEHFRQVSPDRLHVRGWRFQPTTGQLLLAAVPDRNHDRKFDEADAAVPYAVDLRTGQPAVPVLSDSLTGALQRQLARHWPKQL